MANILLNSWWICCPTFYITKICSSCTETWKGHLWTYRGMQIPILAFNLLSANPTNWWNTLKQFVGIKRQIVWLYLTILLGWCWKGLAIRITHKLRAFDSSFQQSKWQFISALTSTIRKSFTNLTFLTLVFMAKSLGSKKP